MKIEGIRTIPGPNIHTHDPVLVMKLSLESLTEKESYQIPGFIERLLAVLPGVRHHHCAMGRPGGFVERLYGGTYFSHIVEHVALELSHLAGIPAFFGKSRYAGQPGHYNIVVEYKAEHGMRYLLSRAVDLVETLVEDNPFPLEACLEEARRITARTELGPSTRAIVEAAEQRGIPWQRLNSGSFVQLGYGIHRKRVEASITDATRCIGVDIASDKELTKQLLDQASIPVPFGILTESEEGAVAALETIGGPVVVKPRDGRQGQGVSLKLSTVEEVRQAFQIAHAYSPEVLVEEYITGKDYRVLVINGVVVGASERRAAHVIGDGHHTIQELIDIANKDPLRGRGHEKPLSRIELDQVVLAYLEKSGRRLDDVPDRDEMIFLREGANLSTGGTASDVTDIVHEDTSRLCQRVARVIGLDLCGIDLVLPDIRRSIHECRGAVLEVNAAPGLRMHLCPSKGKPRNVASAVIDMLYPNNAESRIPIVAVTGTNGKTTTTRMIAHVLSSLGKTVGMTTTDGIYIGDECLLKGDTTGPRSAQTILSDPTVEIAVLETARGGIARAGLAYDWSDVAVVTNIQADHIGQDGIEDIEDLIHIKSLVAERVREGGTIILNADDEHVMAIAKRRRVREGSRKIVYFSLNENQLLMRRHLASGGTGYFLRNGWIIEAVGLTRRSIMRADSIPIAMGGTAEFHIANVLASVAACRALGTSRQKVVKALGTFHGEGHNAGRTNLYRVNSGYVLVDYGHNPHAIESICRMVDKWNGRNVIGVLGVPGDRADWLIEQTGRVAAHGFSRIIIREDADLRGRRKGEVASLLRQAILAEAPDRRCDVVLDECEALTRALVELQEGDIVVTFYEKLDPVLGVLEAHGAVAAPPLSAGLKSAS